MDREYLPEIIMKVVGHPKLKLHLGLQDDVPQQIQHGFLPKPSTLNPSLT